MKKNLSKILIFPIFLIIFGNLSMEKTFAQSCAIASGPITEMTDYAKNLQNELSEMLKEAQSKNPTCEGKSKPDVSKIFDAAHAEIWAHEQIKTDFLYSTQVGFKSDTKRSVRRDEKFFLNLEKNVEEVADKLTEMCALDSERSKHLQQIIIEIETLHTGFQKAALGMPLTVFEGIRENNVKVAEAVSKAYHPSQTNSCENKTEKEKSVLESLKSIMNLGGKMDDALSTWRKAIALLRGDGNGLSPSEYAQRQRQLLQAELSRQGLSSNAQKVMLQNFDCYKAKTALDNNPENIAKARAECLQIPITGIDKLFNFWNGFTWKTGSSDTFAERQAEQIKRKTRSVNIETMYSQLNALTSAEQDTNDATIKGLIDLHVDLQNTNNLLENRIAPMQRNCMK